MQHESLLQLPRKAYHHVCQLPRSSYTDHEASWDQTLLTVIFPCRGNSLHILANWWNAHPPANLAADNQVHKWHLVVPVGRHNHLRSRGKCEKRWPANPQALRARRWAAGRSDYVHSLESFHIAHAVSRSFTRVILKAAPPPSVESTWTRRNFFKTSTTAASLLPFGNGTASILDRRVPS